MFVQCVCVNVIFEAQLLTQTPVISIIYVSKGCNTECASE